MTFEIDTKTHDFDSLSRLEWLETNGLGGWASSTVSGANTRRYHGLLVAALEPPVGRTVLVAKLEETLHVNGEAFELSANRYPGAVHPRGFEHLVSFRRGLFPVFEYRAGGVGLRKTVAAVHGENTTLVIYELTEDSGPAGLVLRPLLTQRDYHALGPGTDLSQEAHFAHDVLRIARDRQVFIQAPGAVFDCRPDWYHRFRYEVEQRRGLDFEEDLWTPGLLIRDLAPGQRLGIVISTSNPRGRDASALLEQETARRGEILSLLGTQDQKIHTLGLAADQFVVRRGEDLRTIIAGYHWFGDWGRDTMIALPGLCLATGRHEDARRILRAFAAHTSQGMLPNRFPDRGETPEYNTVDATLWFFVAIQKYLSATGDDDLIRDELLPVLRDIVAWHDRGTRYGIRVDDDSLLAAGEPGVQLTWMDAKVGDWVVTPRQGKAVEINALWHNALAILADLEAQLGDADRAEELRSRAEGTRRRFNEVFWNETLGCLYDVIDGERVDRAIRPNQLLALSLPFPLLSEARARRVLTVAEDKLLTPVGLRSLAPDHVDYRPIYLGDPLARDGAYHQGTVWGWLLGPYLTALVRYRGDAGKKKARAVVARALEHLHDAGLGTFSEIFDAEPPHTPRGCIAQAWSVAELLRVLSEDLDWQL